MLDESVASKPDDPSIKKIITQIVFMIQMKEIKWGILHSMKKLVSARYTQVLPIFGHIQGTF